MNKHFAYTIGVDAEEGREVILDGGFVDARDEESAERKVSRLAHKKFPDVDWWHSITEEAR